MDAMSATTGWCGPGLVNGPPCQRFDQPPETGRVYYGTTWMYPPVGPRAPQTIGGPTRFVSAASMTWRELKDDDDGA